jgi:hypothetical protein
MISANALMTGSYDYGLVALSVLMAVLASSAALDVAGRVHRQNRMVFVNSFYRKLLPARQPEQLIGRRPYVNARNNRWTV